MPTTQYIGARYVPIMADPIEWSSTKSYEPLTIVLHQGNSYTSRQFVPVGIDITNADFWALTGNYNAQVEQYRQEVQGFNSRITANEDNIAQNDQAIETLQGDVQANTEAIGGNAQAIETLQGDVQANTEAIGNNAQAIGTNTQGIEALNAQMAGSQTSGLLTLIQANAQDIADLASIPDGIMVEGAKPILRYECGIGENTQGGVYFEQDGVEYYAVARILEGTIATVVDIYNLETQYKAGTCTGSFAHGNSMSYADKHLFVGGSDESAIFTEIDCTSISTPYVSRSYDLSALGETRVWAFGVYDDTHFWYTPNNNAIYLCSKQLTDKVLLCYAINPTYMAAVQQGVSYDSESDTFISCKSGYIVMFGSDGALKGGYKFNWQYGYIFTGEVEQATMVDGKVYFHNNFAVALPAGFTDYRRVNAAWVWDMKAPVYAEPFVMPLGARAIHIDATQPTIPNFDRVTPDKWHYPLDAAAYMLAHPEGGRTYQLDTDTPFVCIIPPNVNTINLNSHGVGGVALMNGASVSLTGNVAYASNSPETAMLTTTYNERKLVCAGRSNLFTFFGSTPSDESVWVYNQYGGAAIATEGKLAYVTGSGAKIQLYGGKEMSLNREQPMRPFLDELADAFEGTPLYVRTFDTVTDMQADTDLQSGMTCHTNGFHSVGDGGAAYYIIGTTGTANGMDVLALQDGLVATLVDDVPRKVFDGDSFAYFIQQDNWNVYSGNSVTIDSTIDLTGANARKQIVENCTIKLTANMFTWTTAHEELPRFVNCTFMGNDHAIIDDVSNGHLYCSGSNFINCKFYNCRMSDHALFIQSPRFIDCRWYADTANDFITANCLQDADFTSCQWEWNFSNSSLMNIENASTYYGMQAVKFNHCIAESMNTVFIKATNSFMLAFEDCYFEGITQLINFSQCRAAEGNSPLALYFDRCYINKPYSTTPFVYIDSSYTPASVPGAPKRHIEFNDCKFIGASGDEKNAILSTYAFPNTQFRRNVFNDTTIWDFGNTDQTPVNAQKFTNITATNTAITITNTGDTLHPAWPCLFAGQIKNRTTQVFDILILFIGEISSGPYCKCLSNPDFTFPATKTGSTITIDLTSGNFDYMVRTTGFYLPLSSIDTMYPLT